MENPSKHGPFGAKGVGEMPMDGPAAAVVNAIRHLGLDVRRIPAIPELLMDAPRIEHEMAEASVAGVAGAGVARVAAGS
jgi:hypothetical protein